jgi:hypothetical protein
VYCSASDKNIFGLERERNKRTSYILSQMSHDLPVRKSPRQQMQQVSYNTGMSPAAPCHYILTSPRRCNSESVLRPRTREKLCSFVPSSSSGGGGGGGGGGGTDQLFELAPKAIIINITFQTIIH